MIPAKRQLKVFRRINTIHPKRFGLSEKDYRAKGLTIFIIGFEFSFLKPVL
jgi:hypothetical protein